MVARCLFEQSGVFKNEFIKLGVAAFDYDISNDFNQTDFVCDLFNEMHACFVGGSSVFDSFSSDDLVVAFFPCTFFSGNNLLLYNKKSINYRKCSDDLILDKCIKRVYNFAYYYDMFCTLFRIAIRKGFKLVVENPYCQNFLVDFFPFKDFLVDNDRRLNGDKFKKPTMFYFYNFSPFYNFILEPIDVYDSDFTVQGVSGFNRCLITPQYANRFIRSFLLPGGGFNG